MKQIVIGPELCPVTRKPRKRVYTEFTEPSLTDQSYKKDCDAAYLIERHMKQGVPLGGSNPRQGYYADVSHITNLGDMMLQVQEAQDLFMQVPSKIRKKFDNDPRKYVEFLNDPANVDEAIKLGLAIAPEGYVPPADKSSGGDDGKVNEATAGAGASDSGKGS